MLRIRRIATICVFLFPTMLGCAHTEALLNTYDPTFIWIPRAEIHIGDGLSYQSNYEAIGSFIALDPCLQGNYFFIDFELDRVHPGELATSVGLGWRSVSSCTREIFGVNAFYDTRESHGKTFHQVGVGAELLACKWDTRINGYFPISGQLQVIEEQRFDFPNDLFAIREEILFGMWGFDFEIGAWLLCMPCLNIYGAIGPYLYGSHCCHNLIGGRARLEICSIQNLSLELEMTQDDFFGTQIQGVLRFSVRISKVLDCFRCAFPSVRRNRILVLERTCMWEANF